MIVISGKAGVQVGTQKAWDLCERFQLPRMIFVTDMDIDNVSYRKVVEDLQELYGKRIAPLHMPIRENEKFVGYINIVKNKGRRYIERDKKEECEIPEYSKEYLEKYRETLMESVAETSEEFMDRYFGGEEFSVAEISAALAANVGDGSLVPVCMGSPVNLQGVSNLLDDIVGYFPNPSQRKRAGLDKNSNAVFDADYDFQKPKSATIFKTIVDPFLGKYSLIKVCSGVIKSSTSSRAPSRLRFLSCMREISGQLPNWAMRRLEILWRRRPIRWSTGRWLFPNPIRQSGINRRTKVMWIRSPRHFPR